MSNERSNASAMPRSSDGNRLAPVVVGRAAARLRAGDVVADRATRRRHQRRRRSSDRRSVGIA